MSLTAQQKSEVVEQFGITEFVGGLCLAVGLLTRPASLLILITMAVAFFLQHAPDAFATKEKAFLFGGIALLYLLIGAVVMIVGGLGYYAYEQSRAAADVETQLEMPKLTGN